MEFLGDSVLGLVVNEYLYARYPDRNEGDLTKIKSLVVSRQVLAKKAEEIGLGKYLLLSAGEVESGGRKRSSIIADAMEAVIGAIYLDRGLEPAREFIRKEILVGLHEITGAEEHINYKSLLQELVQGSRKVHPVYRIMSEKGPDHDKQFIVDVTISGKTYGRGTGKSKKEAEQSAAKTALQNLAEKEGGRGSAREREGREPREPRGEGREPREREAREPREGREGRDGRDKDRTRATERGDRAHGHEGHERGRRHADESGRGNNSRDAHSHPRESHRTRAVQQTG
jgi:ribonuclease-3